MAWNEPGGNNDKDPWGGNDQGPPDLDEAFRKFKEKFGGSKSGGGSSQAELPPMNGKILMALFLLLAALYVGFGFYTVDAQERAVVLRLGKYNETVGEGLHFNFPLIDDVTIVNTTKKRSARTSGLILTKDENIVAISVSTQYVVSDPKAFVLDVRDPERSLLHALESALRHALGSETLDEVLTKGREAITIEIETILQRYLDSYSTGIDIRTVNIEDVQPPKDVQEAFDDLIRAKEDKQRLQNEAESYRNAVIPEAQGRAKRQQEEALAYKEQLVAEAEGEAKRFSQLLEEYKKAPEVTRQRLYIQTIEKVLSKSSKVVIDTEGSNLMYLPLDKMMSQPAASSGNSTTFNIAPQTSSSDSNSRRSSRSTVREGR